MSARIMVQGASSGCGKSTVVALLCRHFASKGYKVAPFKATNLSLNSYVTGEGLEIGISQAFQAWAAGIEPEVCMNPVLLKPGGDAGIQLVFEGRPLMDLKRGSQVPLDLLLKATKRAYQSLAERFDIVVIEGAGSPVELNLTERDIANMRTAAIADAPVILVGDIEVGGVFAGLFGTYTLMSKEDRKRVKGYLVNRFRGEENILIPGFVMLSARMAVPSLGVLPMLDVRLPSEDALSLGTTKTSAGGGGDAREEWTRNLDSLLFEARKHLDLARIEDIAFGRDSAGIATIQRNE
ncbi:MAG TPA: cobyric acid synthase [Methanomassiliicoccales archaeon]|nr:cobyric acid synthase [Methanomassiliicoccales archaeon]